MTVQSKFAHAGVYFTEEEWTRFNLAVAQSGKSRRRFMKDCVRAGCGMPPSVPMPGGRPKGKTVSGELTASEVDTRQGIKRNDSLRNRHG